MTDPRHYDYIPLDRAYLCEDCRMIGNNARQCACGSSALLTLWRVLDRESAEREKERAEI